MKYFIYIYFLLKGIYHTNSWDFKYVSCRWGIFLEEELDHLCKDSWDLQVFWDSSTLGKQVCLNKNILSVPCFPGSDVKRQQVFSDQLSNARVRGLGPDTIPGANTPVPQNISTKSYLAGDPYIPKRMTLLWILCHTKSAPCPLSNFYSYFIPGKTNVHCKIFGIRP